MSTAELQGRQHHLVAAIWNTSDGFPARSLCLWTHPHTHFFRGFFTGRLERSEVACEPELEQHTETRSFVLSQTETFQDRRIQRAAVSLLMMQLDRFKKVKSRCFQVKIAAVFMLLLFLPVVLPVKPLYMTCFALSSDFNRVCSFIVILKLSLLFFLLCITLHFFCPRFTLCFIFFIFQNCLMYLFSWVSVRPTNPTHEVSHTLHF